MTAPRQPNARRIDVEAGALRVLELGDTTGPPIVFLHGWPQSAVAWVPMMRLAAAAGHRALAVDLPGVGGSDAAATGGSTMAIAEVIEELAEVLALDRFALVGHDMGGMVAYAYVRRHLRAARVVIMNTVIPGVAPWENVLRNPYVWHFAFHSIPELPELLVHGNQRPYFDYFFDVLSPQGSRISDEQRDVYAAAYASHRALQAGFDWYRIMAADAKVNAADTEPMRTPALYMRGEHELTGDIEAYLAGFRDAGVIDVHSAVIDGAGHFAPDDAPAAAWNHIAAFLAL